LEGGKKIAAIVVLLVVIVAVVAYTIKKRDAPPSPPDSVKQRTMQRIDSKTDAVIVKTLAEWDKLGHKDGKYRNPETGEYTMVRSWTCRSCGKVIPAPELPMSSVEGRGAKPGAMDPHDVTASHVCPACGGSPF